MSHSIYPLNPYNLNLPFLVFAIGSEDNQPHVIRKDGFSMPQLFICLDGEGTLKMNNNIYIIKEGTFFCLMADVPHEYYGNTETWAVDWIAFSGNESELLMKELNFDSGPVGLLHNRNRIETLYKKIFAALQKEDNSGKLMASSLLYEIITELYITGQEPNETALKENDILNMVRAYIENNYSKDMSLEELSALADITPQYLCRLFKNYMNLRPFQYIAMKRIQHAKKILSNKSLSIADAAHMVGYNDCSYFCAVFRKYEKMSPSAFRRIL